VGILTNEKDVAATLARYDKTCVHYNLIAEGVYRARHEEFQDNPFDEGFVPYVVAGLVGFDIGRKMGVAEDRYTVFASKLHAKMASLENCLKGISSYSIETCPLPSVSEQIGKAYDSLLDIWTKRQEVHVGATKILHWLAPELFIMIDSKVASAFRVEYPTAFKEPTQPGYSAKKYVKCLELAQREIQEFDGRFGSGAFRDLQHGTPLARIFDKVAFVVGGEAARAGPSSANPESRTPVVCNARRRK